MPAVYLGLGANIGDKRSNIEQAIGMISSLSETRVVKVSSFYDTAPVGYVDQPDFLNAVVQVETSLTPHELLHFILDIENKLGRKRTIRWGPRVIDIDILLYDGLKVSDNDLIVPHPRMMERRFVMEPLAEIAPDLILPDGRTAAEVAADL